jgi:nitric-oxide synthase, bacterial
MNIDQLFLEKEYLRVSNEDAASFYRICQEENPNSSFSLEKRLETINEEIESTGIYWQQFEEIAFGAKLAWRNAIRCIGRLHWKSLMVRDMRHLSHAEDIFQALVEHIELSTNNGQIRPIVTIFAAQRPGQPGIRIWNSQLIRYAGYQLSDGTVLGDPAEVNFTKELLHLGWRGGAKTAFDILPVVVQLPGEKPQIFELPSHKILEIPIHHPNYDWFAELGLKWYAFPAISNMCLEIGGIRYTAAPFSGWYLVTEIGARNFADADRYNLLPIIAAKLGLETRSDRSLWKDTALVELNKAVLYSYAHKKVSMIDHHTAARQFVLHEEQERKASRLTPADWKWLVPPMSGSTTPIYHRTYEFVQQKPNWFYQEDAWK